MTIRRKLLNFGTRSTDLRFGCGAFSELSKMLAGAVGRPCRAFMVADADLPEDLVLNVRRSLIDAGYRVDEVALDGESASSFATVGGLFAHLASFGLTAEDLVVGVGSAPVCSISAYIARSWCGGSACALVPTTLDAMIMAPTQMVPLSVGVHDAGVSLAPEVGLVICDLDLVRAFDSKRNGLGYALMCAASLAESRKCWESFESTVEGMVAGSEVSLMEAFTSTHTSRMNTAKSASPSARRAFMYGDTTARALAACLKDPSIPGYRLYAEGMRFEARLAVDVCEFPVDEMFALDDRLEDLGIEELQFSIEPEAFVEAVHAERFRRSNRFQFALPKHPGIIRLASVDDDVFERHARAFLASRHP